MKVSSYIRTMIILLSLYSGVSFGSVVLNIEGAQLLGASGINVDGRLLDVSFVDGSCIELFDGCDQASDFFFQDPVLANAANMALLEQVFVDSDLGLFDSDPRLINGCFLLTCIVLTPVGPNDPGLDFFSAARLTNRDIEGFDGTSGGSASRFFDSSGTSPQGSGLGTVYAVFSGTEAPSVVPIPPAFLLFGSGLLMLLGVRKAVK